jgi:hypothetical protein
VISYGALARQLAIPGPGSIAWLTDALEAMMTEDVANGRPLRAALCYARAGQGLGRQPLPEKGFFATARRLACYDGPDSGDVAEGFVATQRHALQFTTS